VGVASRLSVPMRRAIPKDENDAAHAIDCCPLLGELFSTPLSPPGCGCKIRSNNADEGSLAPLAVVYAWRAWELRFASKRRCTANGILTRLRIVQTLIILASPPITPHRPPHPLPLLQTPGSPLFSHIPRFLSSSPTSLFLVHRPQRADEQGRELR